MILCVAMIDRDRSFFGKINRSNWQQHLDSHQQFINQLQEFFQSYDYPWLVDRFIGIIRDRCFQLVGDRFHLAELQINCQSLDLLNIKLSVNHADNTLSYAENLAIADVLAFPLTIDPLLITKRWEIGLLLPSEESAIIDFLRSPAMWQMRGERYAPIVNLHSSYQLQDTNYPWFKYHFVLRLLPHKQPIGFISFTQLSQPNLITPVFSSIPYESTMLGYGIDQPYWGQGLMGEALQVCIPWFIQDRKVKELVAFAEVNNLSSRRLLSKLEFAEYGFLKDAQISPDLRDIYQFVTYKKNID